MYEKWSEDDHEGRVEHRCKHTPMDAQPLQEIEGWGLVMCGIAHDLNNLLTVICGYTELANSILEPDSPAQIYLNGILTAAGLSVNLTRQILSIAKTQVISPQVIVLNDLVVLLEGLLHPLLPGSIRLVTQLQSDL
jgi:two-component system cell cycle sensor histidine kinase/response regulator CckA